MGLLVRCLSFRCESFEFTNWVGRGRLEVLNSRTVLLEFLMCSCSFFVGLSHKICFFEGG